jgi:hypothetical protein
MAEPTGAAFGIYPSSGRRPERLNQSRGVNAPLQLARGWAAGLLGLPGDIEGLVRMLPGIQNETPVLPTSDFYREYLPGYDERPAARAMSGLGALTGGAGATNVARAGLGAVKRATDVNAIRNYVRSAQGVSGMPGAAVIKPKGGNWLAGTVEGAVKPLKRDPEAEAMQALRRAGVNRSDEELREFVAAQQLPPQESALNRWIDKKLAGYIRNEMGTPEDPVRALAERGVLHFEPQMAVLPSDTAFARTSAGYPRHGVAKSQLATDWEVLADAPIDAGPAQRFHDLSEGASFQKKKYEDLIKENPWLLKVPPETTVYSMYPGSTARNENLGFNHLIDELRNAVNPESGLPRELLWKYSDLDKVTVPQAVQRVADINKWRAAQKAEADAARAMNPATQVFKEYPEQGYKWVELKMPEKTSGLPEGYSLSVIRNERLPEGHMGARSYAVVDPQGRMLEGVGLAYTEADALDKFSRAHYGRSLEDALKYEGEVMGHCVGGYCPDVVEGRSRIFSLRDAKGQPHVTIETNPKGTRTVPEGDEDALVREAEEVAWSVKGDGDERAIEDIYEEIYDELLQERFPVSELDDIVQIKGKANRAPKEEYLPYVQDFVRSGQWGRVGDIQNTGMRPMREVFNNAELETLKKAGAELPEHGYLTGEQIQQLHNMVVPEGQRLKYDWRGNVVGDERQQNFARGGAVRAGPATYDPDRIAALADQLMTMEA